MLALTNVQSALEQCDDGDPDEADGCEIIPVPEPGPLAMLLSGLGLPGILHRRRNQ